MAEPSISDLLHNITANIDLDLSTTIADVLNLYFASLRRNGGRQVLGPSDAVRILYIINQLMEAYAQEREPELIPGAPTRPKAKDM